MSGNRLLRCIGLLLAGTLWFGGRAAAQPLNCTADAPNPTPFAASTITVNGSLPPGAVLASQGSPGSAVRCSGGTPGMPIELAVRFPPERNARTNTFGAGVLLDTGVSGIGYVLNFHAPHSVSSAHQVMLSATRNASPVQILANVGANFSVVRGEGALDFLTDHRVHDKTLMTVQWRSPGVQDAWTDVITWRHDALSTNAPNLYTQTCHFGDNPAIPVARTHMLGSVSAATFAGVGIEARGGGATNAIHMKCRNFTSGSITLWSAGIHPTMPGVLTNTHPGPGAATGVGVRLRHGPDGAEWNLTAPWRIPVGSQGETYAYDARFVQTGAVITPGPFSASLTLTIHYD